MSSPGRFDRHVRQYRFGDYKLDLEGGFLLRGDEEVALRAKSFEVLTYLVERHGRLVTKTELIEGVWRDAAVTDNSLAQCLVEIRRALGDDAQELVRTVARRGYLFVAPVTTPPVEFPRNSGEAAPILAPAPSKRLNWRILGVAIVLPALAGAGVLFVWLSEAKTVAPRTPARITRDGLAETPTISRDGNLLAYTSKAGGGKMHVWVGQTAGGQAAQVTRGGDDETAPDFSPDGTRIVFRSERDGGGIYTVSTLGGGEPQLLVKGGTNPRFSPNGKDVLFFSDDLWTPRAYVVSSLPGGPPRRVCPNWATDYGFWAPDGSAILFHGGRKGNLDDPIWMLASVAGGDPTEFRLPGDNYSGWRFPHVEAWRKTRDGRQWILFGSGIGDTYNLFRVAVGDGKLAGNPEQLTAGAGVSGHGDFSADGKLVYDFDFYGGQILVVPVDTDRAQTKGQPEQITHTDGVINLAPSISRDGRWLAYAARNPVSLNSSIRLRDLATGADRQLIEGPYLGETSISPDGSRVAYSEGDVTTFLIPVAGGSPTQLCEYCTPRGYSSDGSLLLTQKVNLASGHARAVTVRIPGGEAREFLADQKYPLWHPFFSWDDRWVSFKTVPEEPRARLMIAPVRNGVPAGQSEWVSITDGKNADDKPQLSPDGNTLYFTSERDGHLCIWAQHLDRSTKRPINAPFVVQHFHNAQWRIYRYHTELSVARDKIVTNFREDHSDIWMMKLD